MLGNEKEKAIEQDEKDMYLEQLKQRITRNFFQLKETANERIGECSDILDSLDVLANWEI